MDIDYIDIANAHATPMSVETMVEMYGRAGGNTREKTAMLLRLFAQSLKQTQYPFHIALASKNSFSMWMGEEQIRWNEFAFRVGLIDKHNTNLNFESMVKNHEPEMFQMWKPVERKSLLKSLGLFFSEKC